MRGGQPRRALIAAGEAHRLGNLGEPPDEAAVLAVLAALNLQLKAALDKILPSCLSAVPEPDF